MELTIKAKHIILFFVLLCVVLLIFNALKENSCICKTTILDPNITGIINRGSSIGESMNYPDNNLHLFGRPENITIGDVISFNNSRGTKTLHRVIEIDDTGNVTKYITKGDNNRWRDDPITLEEINYKLLETIYFDT